MRVLFHDAWHVLTHIDGRFWQTMRLLLLRPGELTREYFAERRARYLPPVRVYLALSLLFFACATLAPREPGTGADFAAAPAASAGAPAGSRPAQSTHADFNLDFNDCSEIESSFKWLESAMRTACTRHAGEGGRPVHTAFIANIPKMMFVFLPVMALVMLALYWRPRRYYVEHLVFFLHTHAAVFSILLLELALSWGTAALPALRPVGAFTAPAAGLYAVWYVYRAMRAYYGQRRSLTLSKMLVVGVAYALFLATTLLATLVLSALSA